MRSFEKKIEFQNLINQNEYSGLCKILNKKKFTNYKDCFDIYNFYIKRRPPYM